jgi:hypothetical protein
VAEGKNDPIYNAHSYHTKVPHKAIMRYILHYTRPGDVVLDGFCGTGMTGVAAQLCADRLAVSELGYSTDPEGNVRDAEGQTISKIGTRAVIMNDLAPAATLISAGYTLTTDPAAFVQSAQKLLNQFDADYGWMHQTLDKQTKKPCPIDYTIWSEGFACPHCSHEIDFWHLAYDEDSGKIDSDLKCPGCRAELTKRDLVRRTTTFLDPITKTTRKRQVLNPVLIVYSLNGRRLEKEPDDADLANIQKVEKLLSNLDYPTDPMMFSKEGDEWGDLYRGYHQGITRVDDFHLPRQLATTAILWKMGEQLRDAETKRLWKFTLQSIMVSFTRRNRFLKNAFSQVNRGLSGTLYIGSTISEPSPRYLLAGKLRRFTKAVPRTRQPALVTTQSLSFVRIPPDSIDYIFLDPPFGDNLPYSELNFLWEAWLRVFTNAPGEAIVSGKQLKTISNYTQLMTACLARAYSVLKPGRWLTVEFHNSKNSVWTAIQEALGLAGFIIADVRVLDKGMLTKKQLHANAVNKDLVISAYKPNAGLEQRFTLEAGAEEGVWDFVRAHLKQLPVFVCKEGRAEPIAERQPFLLFDRMVAFHVQRSVTVPITAAEFYQGLTQRFSERDGMFFLENQASEYDKKRLSAKELLQVEIAIVGEATAIEWLRQLIAKTPQTFQDIHPQFIREIAGWQKFEKPLELSDILRENFLCYDGTGDVPSQIHSYLSTNFKEWRNLEKDASLLKAKAKDRWYVPDPRKAVDLEKLRERSLLQEFEAYAVARDRRLKTFRIEAVRAGFKKAWQEKDYATIIAVGRKIEEAVVQEDPKLLMWFTNALNRAGVE